MFPTVTFQDDDVQITQGHNAVQLKRETFDFCERGSRTYIRNLLLLANVWLWLLCYMEFTNVESIYQVICIGWALGFLLRGVNLWRNIQGHTAKRILRMMSEVDSNFTDLGAA